MTHFNKTLLLPILLSVAVSAPMTAVTDTRRDDLRPRFPCPRRVS